MTTQRWISFLLISLSLALVAWGWLARSSFCLDSSLVERIDIVGAFGPESLPACSVSRDALFSDALADLKTDLEPRFRELERSLDFMQMSFKRLRISIINSDEPLVRVSPDHLLLSRSVLSSRNVLEKAVLLSLLQQKRQDPQAAMSLDETLWAEVFSDVFLSVQKGDLQIQDPLLNQVFTWSEGHEDWPFVLRTKKVYCQDSSRSFLHISDCQQGRISTEQSLASLRPFLGASLASSLATLSPGERLEWLQTVLNHWRDRQIQRDFFGSSVGPEDQQELVDAARLVRSWMENFRRWGAEDPTAAVIAQRMQFEIQKRGFRPEPNSVKTDFVVLLSSSESEPVLQGLREASLLDARKKVLVIRQNQAWVLPDLKPFPSSWLGEYHAQQALLIQCSIPSVDRLRALAGQVQKLMLIRACPPLQNVAWSKLLTNGIEDFLRANPKMPFVQFHLPSLRAALLKKNLNPIPLLEEGRWESPFFQQIGWEPPRWDGDLQAFRSRSVIEAIESFRVVEKPATTTSSRGG